jgi:hypothetical protein
MSSVAVRQKVEAWLMAQPVKFYPSINEEIEPVEDVWCTVYYAPSSSQKISFCGAIEHKGQFIVVHFANPGLSWDKALEASDMTMNYIVSQVDGDGKFAVTGNGEPVEFTAGDGIPWYGVEVSYNYVSY